MYKLFRQNKNVIFTIEVGSQNRVLGIMSR